MQTGFGELGKIIIVVVVIGLLAILAGNVFSTTGSVAGAIDAQVEKLNDVE